MYGWSNAPKLADHDPTASPAQAPGSTYGWTNAPTATTEHEYEIPVAASAPEDPQMLLARAVYGWDAPDDTGTGDDGRVLIAGSSATERPDGYIDVDYV